jgi:hypothetical protein
VGLEAYAQWALNHHSRRFARHRSFPYLMYDVIRLRMASYIESLTADQKYRSMIKGLLVRWGMPAFWLTINPADLRDPIVLILGGVRYGSESFPIATAAIRKTFAISNPVAVAQFFHLICTAIFEDLLRFHSGNMGILGYISNHFGVVETNGRGMLHMHALIWATRNLDFPTLRERVLRDEEFKARMINFLESVVVESVRPVPDGSGIPDRQGPLSQEQLMMMVMTGRTKKNFGFILVNHSSKRWRKKK